jgi:DNA adenine methylase
MGMRYSGGKVKIGGQIADVLNIYRNPGQVYVEPFLGAGGVMRHMGGPRIGADINCYDIAMLRAAQSGWIPRLVEEDEYKKIRDNKDKYPPELVGFVGTALSWGGKWFGGWARGGYDCHTGGVRAIKRLSVELRGLDLYCNNYDHLEVPQKSLIYCDPPYTGTNNGYSFRGFDSASFHKWCRGMASKGHNVFISEYSAPDDFIIVWEKALNKNTDATKPPNPRVERVYMVPGGTDE